MKYIQMFRYLEKYVMALPGIHHCDNLVTTPAHNIGTILKLSQYCHNTKKKSSGALSTVLPPCFCTDGLILWLAFLLLLLVFLLFPRLLDFLYVIIP